MAAVALLAYSIHAAPLNLIQEPAVAQGQPALYSALVNDSFAAIGVASADDWSFEGEVGDQVSVRLEATVGNSRPKIRLLNASDSTLYSFDGGTDGVATMYAFRIATPGTYRVRVYTDNATSAYALRVDLGRGVELEVENNDGVATANAIVPKVGAGKFDFFNAGTLPATDTTGDTIALGLTPAGSTLTGTVQLPSSTLTSADLTQRFFERRANDRALDLTNLTYATVPHHAVFDAIETNNALTIEAWVYIRSWPQGYFTIFDKYEATGDWGWSFSIQNGGGGISFWNGVNDANTPATTGVTPSLNTWHHVVVAYDHAGVGTDAIRFYLDGALITSKATPGPLLDTNGEPAYIGFSPSGGDEYSDGAISEIRLWNRALTTAEVQANYAATNLTGSETNLVGLWRFDEGAGLVATDASATGNNAILGGGDPTRVPGWSTGAIRPQAPVAGANLNRTFSADTVTWLQLSAAANRGLSGRYLISGSLADTQNLQVVSTSLPGAGETTTNYFQSFSVTFDDELDPVAANNLSNFELRGAGADTVFGTADDIVYVLGSPNYVNGTTISFALVNGPIQAGAVRFTIGLGLHDRAGNPLSGTFTRNFTSQEFNGYRIENQSNNTFATATSLAASGGQGAGFGGSWQGGVEYATAGAQPTGTVAVDLDGDGKLDLVTTNYNGGTIAVLKGNGDGTFAAAVTYPAPNNPFQIAVGDVNGDTKPDVVVTRLNGNAVRVFLNTGSGGVLAAGVDYPTGTQPHWLVLQDLNGDGRLDIATANNSGNSVSVLYGNGTGANGDGTFAAKVDIPMTGNPYAIAAGDLNGDGLVDLAVGTYGDKAVKILYRQAGGTYAAGDVFAWGPSYGTLAVAIGDVNGDGRADLLASQEYFTQIRRWHQQANGTLLEGAPLNYGGSTHGYSLLVKDINGDSKPDVIAGGYYNVLVFENLGAGVFGSPAYPDMGTSQQIYAVVAADFNNDGRIDLAAPVWGRNTLRVFLGRGSETMQPDGSGTIGRGRGDISINGDVDFFSFTARAGDRVFVTSETPSHAGATGQYYRVYRPEGDQITEFGGYNGSGQSQFVAPVSGTYYVRVEFWYAGGDYRFVVSTQPGSYELESEANDSAGQADGLTWTQAGNTRSAAVAGIINLGDPGDWFGLGYLDVGTQITLNATKPASSGLGWILDILDSSSVVVISAPANAPSLSYTIPATKAGTYYARIRANTGADLVAQYRLALTLGDTQAPVITGDTLPAEGSTLANFFGNFSLSFSEILQATTVNNVANYDLRAAGPDGLFDTADDVLYSVALTGAYGGGLGASYRITDGPPLPGSYRVQIKTGLLDLYGNPVAAVYERKFAVTAVPGYVFESRSNNTFATATSLAVSGGQGAGFGGSWQSGVEYASGGAQPAGTATVDLDGDGKLDLVTANYNAGTISVLKGNGDGTFAAAVTYPAPNNPFQLKVGDVNGDSKPDVVVTRINGNAVRVFLNTGTGGVLAAGVDYPTGTQPHWLVLQDLNGDGRLDIATANNNANTVSVLYGNGTGATGDGTFAAKVDFPVSGNPYAIAAGDLNGDGLVDLAVGTSGDKAVKVFPRQANGTYAAGDVFSWGPSYGTLAVAIADVNGDNRADLLALQEYFPQIRRWHQQANGTLLEGDPLNFGGTTHGYSLLVKDLNGDNKPEVISGGYYNILVFENLGSGVFSSPAYPDMSSSQSIYSVVAGDFNGDGRIDLAAPVWGRNTLRVFLGRGPETMQPDGSGFIQRARGEININGDVDFFSFTAKAGDRVFVTSETPSHAGATGQYYRVYRPEGDQITEFGGYNGSGQSQFVAPVSGTYYVRVEFWYAGDEYRFVVSTQPGTYELESEVNDSAGQADGLTWAQTGGPRSAAVAGIINLGDPGDWFALGFLDVGTTVTLNASKPDSSNLTWVLDIINSSNVAVATGTPGGATLAYTIPSGGAGNYYARVRASAGADLVAQYRLALTLGDSLPPTITGDTLPTQGSTVTDFFGDFSLSFSEILQTAAVNNVANYDLRAAGADGLFDTGDDVLYSVTLTGAYNGGLGASFRVSDGPPLPGLYRFQAKTGLADLYGNPLAAVYTRSFTVAAVSGYVFESRSNNTFATATSLAVSGGQGAGFGGSWQSGVEYGSGGAQPAGTATVDLDGDGKLDLVTANYNGGTISVLKGNGDGTFAAAVTYPAPNNPFQLAVGDVNGDSKPDVVVTRLNGNAVRVFLNTGTGGVLGAGVDYTTGTQPHWLVLQDLNGDGRLDIATANNNANSVSILYGNGDGTFAAKSDFAVTGNPYSIAAGDLNGDGRVDLAIGTAGDKAIKLFYRQANGSYAAGDVFSWGPSYGTLAVAIADLDGDNRADLLALQEYFPQIRRWNQQANGTLLEGDPFNFGGTTHGYSLLVKDLNGDNKPEVISGGYYNILVFENLGSGVFSSPAYPDMSSSQQIYSIVAGDFNGDGRMDLAAPVWGRNTLRVFLGRGLETMQPDGSGFVQRGRGNISVNGDVDFFSFTAKAGDRVFVTSETPSHAGATGQYYRIYRPEGDQVTEFGGYNGSGQTQFVAPVSGTYYVRIEYWYAGGEYRFTVSTQPGTFDLESETNDSAGQADPLTWAQAGGPRTATVAGIINYGDPGDWFALGFLDVGTQLTLTASKPPSSNLTWILDIINSSNVAVAAGAAGATPLSYTIPSGAGGTYYARVRASAGSDLQAQYRLVVSLADTTPPTITANSLPAEGTRINQLYDRFTLTFSKDMDPAAVNNTANYELRAAGVDGAFDTLDDVIVPLGFTSAYSTGLTVELRTANGGPLPVGTYRFKALPGLLDKFGNALSPVHVRTFGVDALSGYTYEAEPNGTALTATPLPLESSQPDLFGAGGRGYLFNNSDVDFWSFNLQAGDRVYIQGEVPGNPGATGLAYQILNPAGVVLSSLTADYTGQFAFGLFTAADTGAHKLRVSVNYGYNGEYRFRIYVLRGGLQLEVEPNNSIAAANALSLTINGTSASGSMHGLSRVSGDLDYVNLGTLQAGTTVFLSSRQPTRSTFLPIVSLYNAGGTLLSEAVGGRAGDSVSQIPISVTGTYYALVRTSGNTSGLDSEYILDVLVVPTADISFPNLQVTSLTPPPASGLKSGDPTTISFRVDNLGNLATGAVTWIDRVVLSTDTIYGNADDIEVAVFPHSGPLAPAASYSVTSAPITIPDGISGSYYVIVRTDHTNTVSEFVLEGDNETVTDSPIAISLATYPDLVIEGLSVTDPDGSGNRTASWTLANRGLGAAASGFSERFLVRNNSTGTVLVNNLLPVASNLGANATLPRQASFATTTPGIYSIEVAADAQSQRFEYNPSGHTAAETNNGASTGFTIIQFFTITVAADPAEGGTVAGAGTFVEGSNRTVTATAISPYLFLGWYEGTFLRSVNASYSSPLFANRALTARFGLPAYNISTQVDPAGTGIVTGAGVYALGANVSLGAAPVPGYRFSNWSEGATNLGSTSPLTFTAGANRVIKANFLEANPTHVVTTATVPASVAVVTGAGTYNNGTSTNIVAPAAVASGANEYVFVRFLLNGAEVSQSPSLSKSFTTLDPPALAYVAEYRSQPQKPAVTQVTSNLGNLIGATANFRLTLHFDRPMNQAVKPVVELQSGNATSIPSVPVDGTWSTADTYAVPAITFGANNGGTYSVRVSVAQDTQGRAMDPAQVYSFTVDVTPPPPAAPTLGTLTSTSAAVDWTGYSAPADIASFRVYRSATTFTSLDGLSPLASLPGSARSFVFGGLTPDTDYFVAIVPVDSVGNAPSTITPLTVRVASTVPPAVDFEVEAASTNSARVTWTFNTTGQIGFSGFKVYRNSSAFSSISGLTPIATLGPTVRSFVDAGLDRSQTHHYAVVGYNQLNQSLTNVTSKPWSDPLAGIRTTSFTATEPLLIINQPLTISGGATFTVPPGTVVAFGPGASLTVADGRLVADGTIFAPIVFTSLADVDNGTRGRGAWEGITLSDGTRPSTLRNVWVKYGRGLAITAGTHVIETLGAAWNDVGGLRLSGAVTLSTSAYLSDNAVGASIEGGASLTLTGSVLRNNAINASAQGGGTFTATGNWWGTADGAAIAASLSGPVNAGTPLAGEPILTRGLRSADGATSTGVTNLPLQLASLNASGYRVSEDSSFNGVLFVDVPRNPLLSDLFNTASWPLVFPLSPGGGTKVIFAQFRSPTGVISPTVSFTTNYITSGPTIASFSLAEGQTINRPVTVNAVVTSALPLTAITFSVDDVVVATSPTSPFSTRWDIRPLAPGLHRVRLLATDSAGNIASRSLNVVVNPTPPPRPVITAPADGSRSTVTQLDVVGTAEPFADLKVNRNGSVVATVVAGPTGAFIASGVQFVEGTNEISVAAADVTGATASTSVFVNVDSGPPAPVTLLPLVYNGADGLFVDWDMPTTGEVPVAFRVYWHTAPFTSVAEATGQSAKTLRSSMNLTVPDGLRYFAVVGYDDAGNASVLSNVRSYQVDLTPPSFTIGYNQAMPVGPGTLGITITASEPLAEAPLLFMRPSGGGQVAITLTSAGGNNYSANFPVTNLVARTGPASIGISGKDIAGNAFTGSPSGPALVFDLTKPTGVLTTSQPAPIRTATDVSLSVSLVLSELPKVGTVPTLSFAPPVGSTVSIPLAGAGLNWSGNLVLTSAMDNGFGTFLLNTEDAAGNVGTVLTVGEKLELYNTATPTPPAVPSNVTIQPLKGGYIRLSWSAADRAQSYRLYREAGAGATPPVTMVQSDITSLTVDDLPPADGPYRYVVTSFRLEAESGPSGVRATTSDRLPPPAPTATTATLGTTGINVAWTPAAGEAVAKWIIYRNGVAITTIANPSATSFVDSPPRGVITYAVAAADTLGNEAMGPNAVVELFVGAVANLRATVDPAVGTSLTWTSTDSTGVGYNLFRNGTKQNAAPLSSPAFVDTLPAGGQPVRYSVTAINASGQQSAPRDLVVQPLTVSIRLNASGSVDQPSVARYFDLYSIFLTADATATAPVTFSAGEIIRAAVGEAPVQVSFVPPGSVAVGDTRTAMVVVPAPNIAGTAQGASLTLTGTPDAGGSVVIYRIIQDFAAGGPSGLMMTVSASSPPLAGGLTDFTVEVFNRGHAAAELILARGNNTQPGDLEMLIISGAGVLVSSSPYTGVASGAVTNAAGQTVLRVEPGASVRIPFTSVLVPEGLGQQEVTFRAQFKAIYNSLGTPQQQVAGPLEGTMASSLRVTPYFGSAAAAQPNYSDSQPIVINGQAINRANGQPVPNAPLRLGFRVRGAVIFKDVVTDGTGAYSYSYTPLPGLAGDMTIWASHPDVIDQLNQAHVSFYRLFAKTGRVEATMSKNDVLDFDITLLNPGDLALTSPTVTFRAYRMVSGAEVPVTSVTGIARVALPATLAPQADATISLRLQAALDAPDDALIEFTFGTAQGASTKVTGTVSFRPALAVLTTISPTTGYAEAGVSRGNVKSVEVTVQNRGLRPLTGVKLVPPAGVPWMQVQAGELPDVTGAIPMPDIPIGGSRSFSVVFAPPDTVPIGFYNDFLLIKGNNAVGDYRLNLFATVTSLATGNVQFTVTNTFDNPVPNTSIWLRNSTLGTEVGPVLTDANGHAVVTGLMEGDWQWKTSAAGHGATQGVITVVPDQTVGVETELSLNMVSVKFSVVPVPFTDYYEIKIEQTFQTRTPIPNLIMSPPHQSLHVEAGWKGTLMYTLRNEGLRSLFDVNVTGANLPTMRATPMVNFIPELLAQETIQVPVFFEYFGPVETTTSGPLAVAPALRSISDTGKDGKSVSALVIEPPRAASAQPAAGVGSFLTPQTAANTLTDIYDCYKEFKYGTITLQAWGGVSSVSGKAYTIGVNATIDVDEILALVCDGECPENWTGSGLIGKAANWACSKIVGKIIEEVGKKTEVIDVICKASNIIKALACAAAQIPTAPPSSTTSISGGISGGYYTGGGYQPTIGGNWGIFGAGCFAAGTRITLADGSTKSIEELSQGDRLLSAATGRVDAVAQVMTVNTDHLRELTFRPRGDANAPVTTLRLTHDHRVWVDGRGWVFSVDVKVGDWLHGEDGRMHEVTANNRIPGRHEVYGLHMKNDRVAYAAGILVEDQCFRAAPTFEVNPQRGAAR